MRKPIGIQAKPPVEIPVVGPGITPAPTDVPVVPEEPAGPAPELNRGQTVDYWDDQLVGLIPLVATVLRPSPGQTGRYAVNVHMNGMLRFHPDVPAVDKPRKFCLTVPE
jgi:hypothetical protein